MKVGILRAVVAACLLGGVGAGDAGAATGDLMQKPGLAGCLSADAFCSPGVALGGVVSVAVSPDGKNAYTVSGSDGGAVAVFDRAPDGTLTQKAGTAGCIADAVEEVDCVDGKALNVPQEVTVSPDGKSAYVASQFSHAVAVFDRAPDGRLTQKTGMAGCVSNTGRSEPNDPTTAGQCLDGAALENPLGVTVSPDGTSAYVVATFSDGHGGVTMLDRAADGTLTQKTGTAGCITDNGAGPCIDGVALTGARSMTVSSDGRSAYLVSWDQSAAAANGAVLVFDRAANGSLTQKSGTAGCISEDGSGPCVDGRAFDFTTSVTGSPDGKSVYVTAYAGMLVFDRAADGALTQKAGTAGCISDGGFGAPGDPATAGACLDGRAITGAYSAAVSPDGQSAYSASYDGGVAVLDRGADGTLSQKSGAAGCISDTGAGGCVNGTALDGARWVVVSPDGRSAYVTSRASSAVAVFDREPAPPPPAIVPPPVRPPLPPPLASDATAPLLSAMSLSPAAFRAAGGGPSIAARVGSTVSYALSEPATVRFTVERAAPGRRAGGRCAKPRRSNRRARRCTRYVAVRGSLSHDGKTGRNAFTFTGRLGARRLAPGRYRLGAVATDAAGNASQPRRSPFRVVRR